MRCFVGIDLPDATRAALLQAGALVRSADEQWRGERWVRADHLHITLAFLGEVPQFDQARLEAALSSAFETAHAFELLFARLQPVPTASKAAILWAEYEDPLAVCADLASAVAQACSGIGGSSHEKRFQAHVTLARARRPRRVGHQVLEALSSAAVHVPECVSVSSATLFSSMLERSGPQYTRLHTWRLRS